MPRTPTQDIGNRKLSLLMKTIWENQRRLTINPPTTTIMQVHPTTTLTTILARRTTRSPTKARSSRTLESNSKPLDLL
jgi:hypothetical protein